MVNEPRRWSLSLNGHGQRRQRQLGAHMVTHRPADDFTGVKIKNSGQIQPALCRMNIRDVRQPFLLGSQSAKIAIKDIGGHWQIVTAVCGRDAEPALGNGLQVVQAHQVCNTAATDALTFGPQRGAKPDAPVLGANGATAAERFPAASQSPGPSARYLPTALRPQS